MRPRHVTPVALLAAFSLASFAWAGDEKLKVGDAAPGLDIETWVNGDETTIESGNVYIVEFWATWCAPCRKAMPHLTELQKLYGEDGLTIIGISFEKDAEEKVEPFFRRNKDKMGYTVAIDRRNSTKRAWFDAAKMPGIPASFIVDRQGKIAWIGNPHDQEFDGVIKQVLSGRYNPKLAREAEPRLKGARSARKVRNWRLAMRHYDEVIELDSRVFAEVALERFQMMLVDMKGRDEAYAYAREGLLAGHFVDDDGAMAMLAVKVVDDPDIPDDLRDMDFALEAAEAALALSPQPSPQMLATLAKVQYRRGELDKAVAAQKRAYFLVSQRNKSEYRRVLRTYQEAAKGLGASGSARR